VIEPGQFRTVPMPTYPEIRLALTTTRELQRRIGQREWDRIHIATEGPLGIAARRACGRLGLPFTTSYHTRFPEYLAARAPVPLSWTYAWLRWFHNGGTACLVATPKIAEDLRARGFRNLVAWTRGVDRELFRPRDTGDLAQRLGLASPVFLHVGRVSVEKNIAAFLDLDLPGTKLVVGDGPALEGLRRKYPEVVFVGAKAGEELAMHYNLGDVFVFPSRTDTFGNVLLEAMACGLPVAAYPVPGPIDVVADSGAGVLAEDLRSAAMTALRMPREKALSRAAQFNWRECARIFLEAAPERMRQVAE
jgi:glycosyltransferase involved in cell wall biosynthesis